MNRAIIVSLVLASASASAGFACDKSGADAQGQANQAQDKANREIGQANAQANQAQGEADRKIGAAQADFLKTREDYRHKRQLDIDSLDKDIANLDAKSRTGTATAKAKLQSALPAIHAQRDAFVKDFRSLDNTDATTFDGARDRLDKEWSDLKAMVDRAD